MKLSKKLTEALREAHIDFTSFNIVDIAPQKDGHAVVILAAKTPKTMPRFNVQYRGHSLWYDDLHRLMDICVEEKLYTRLAADRLLYYYNESLREN